MEENWGAVRGGEGDGERERGQSGGGGGRVSRSQGAGEGKRVVPLLHGLVLDTSTSEYGTPRIHSHNPPSPRAGAL